MGDHARQRIETAIEALHFTPSALTRAIRYRRTHILGVLIYGITDIDENVSRALTPPLLAGINTAADKAEYNVLLYSGWLNRPHRHPGLPFLDGHIDGLLWVSPGIEEPVLERVAAAGLPIVALLSRRVPDGVGYVASDNFGAMRSVVAHLAERGHHRIAFIGPIHISDFLDRRDGYRAALAEVGLPWDPELEVISNDNPWARPAYSQAIAAWLALAAPPTAIVAPNDGVAEILIEEVQALGRRVPEDIAITGFDDIPDAARIGGGLTTVRQPFRRIGEIAAERLLALIDGAPVDQCRITVPTSLSVRKTTVVAGDAPPTLYR
jgi:LacI family transcriptional regulator